MNELDVLLYVVFSYSSDIVKYNPTVSETAVSILNYGKHKI